MHDDQLSGKHQHRGNSDKVVQNFEEVKESQYQKWTNKIEKARTAKKDLLMLIIF